jgi:hypothetical protein
MSWRYPHGLVVFFLTGDLLLYNSRPTENLQSHTMETKTPEIVFFIVLIDHKFIGMLLLSHVSALEHIGAKHS